MRSDIALELLIKIMCYDVSCMLDNGKLQLERPLIVLPLNRHFEMDRVCILRSAYGLDADRSYLVVAS